VHINVGNQYKHSIIVFWYRKKTEIKVVQPFLRFILFKPEKALNGDSMVIQHCCRLFAPAAEGSWLLSVIDVESV
jgi:hypothetical protein